MFLCKKTFIQDGEKRSVPLNNSENIEFSEKIPISKVAEFKYMVKNILYFCRYFLI